MKQITKIGVTSLVIALWTFLWWLGGFNFYERGILALIYTITTFYISIRVYYEL